MTLRSLSVLYSILIVISLTALLMGYRLFVEHPQIRENISRAQDRELQILQETLDREFKALEMINFDYAVWDDSYQFLKTPNDEYIDVNFIDDTFLSLELNVVVFINENLELVWGMGRDYANEKNVDVSMLLNSGDKKSINALFPRDDNNPNNLRSSSKINVPQKSGFYNTKLGPVMFSSVAVRNSDGSGEPHGAMIFIQFLRSELIPELEKFTRLKISMSNVDDTIDVGNIPCLEEGLNEETFAAKRQRVIRDVEGVPILILDIEHAAFEPPTIIQNTFYVFQYRKWKRMFYYK